MYFRIIMKMKKIVDLLILRSVVRLHSVSCLNYSRFVHIILGLFKSSLVCLHCHWCLYFVHWFLNFVLKRV